MCDYVEAKESEYGKKERKKRKTYLAEKQKLRRINSWIRCLQREQIQPFLWKRNQSINKSSMLVLNLTEKFGSLYRSIDVTLCSVFFKVWGMILRFYVEVSVSHW